MSFTINLFFQLSEGSKVPTFSLNKIPRIVESSRSSLIAPQQVFGISSIILIRNERLMFSSFLI